MEQNDFHEILKKYFSGQASPEERQMIDAWYEAMGEQPEAPMPGQQEAGLEARYRKNIEQQIKQTPGTGWQKQGRGNTAKLVKYFTGIAASLLIAITTYYYLGDKKPVQQEVAAAGKKASGTWQTIANTKNTAMRITLPDSSNVTLEPKSSIRFLTAFAASTREIYLDGEGFFEVVHNEKQPFLVYAKDVTTKVLGTSFTVKALKDDKAVTVAVRTGKVSVFTNRGNIQDEKSAVVLTPNQQLVYHRDAEKISRQIVEAPQPVLEPEAIERMRFEDAPLEDIFRAIEKMYGIEIVFDESLFSSCTLTTSLSGSSLYNRLDIICSAIGAKYTIDENRIVIDGKGCH